MYKYSSGASSQRVHVILAFLIMQFQPPAPPADFSSHGGGFCLQCYEWRPRHERTNEFINLASLEPTCRAIGHEFFGEHMRDPANRAVKLKPRRLLLPTIAEAAAMRLTTEGRAAQAREHARLRAFRLCGPPFLIP